MSRDQSIRKTEPERQTPEAAPLDSERAPAPSSSRAQAVEAAEVARSVHDDAAGQGAEAVGVVQAERKSSASLQAAEIRSIAGQGLAGQGQALPHLDAIQESFGSHDVSGVEAHVGGSAEKAAGEIGATAYTSGDRVAFKGTPDLRTAAHEAAHVVQQRAGVSVPSGVGQTGDAYEKHADAVADRVVAGKSAEPLLSGMEPGAGTSTLVQLLGQPLDQESDVKPAYGEDKGSQRRYSPEQYIKMWEEEQGRALTDTEKKTIKRGCIGLTATNVAGGGNPIDYAEGCWATFDQAHDEMIKKNKTLNWMAKIPFFGKMLAGEERYILFAKLFWSNQDPDPEKRKKSDPNAFLPDAKTGKVDMSKYKYKAQPGYVNFDYGWWDEASQCFWHANHMDYGDPKDPMKVLQSTREKFDHKISYLGSTRYGYIDFDRVVFCIALAKNYNPGLAAIASAKP